jgi:hypothetical protein
VNHAPLSLGGKVDITWPHMALDVVWSIVMVQLASQDSKEALFEAVPVR